MAVDRAEGRRRERHTSSHPGDRLPVTRIVLATASEAFEHRVREAYEGALDGELRVWHDGLLGGEPATAVAELTRAKPWVVSVGPDLHPDAALQLVRAFDRE